MYAKLFDCKVYPTTLDALFFKHQMRHLSHLYSDIDPGNIFPVCPKVVGIDVLCMYLSMKAKYSTPWMLFGLPWKKAAGVS